MMDVTKSPLVSICIPTFNRPLLLQVALESCLKQTYENIEIIVGDDSNDDRSETIVSAYEVQYPGKIRYIRNRPSLGQAGNVNALFNNATGPRLVLLHDDDLLLPGALNVLLGCWQRTPSLAAAFGKQQTINMSGDILLSESERANIFFGRTAEASGLVTPGLAGIRQMFPNDGYMVLTEKARRIGFRPFDEVGAACDFDFAIRYCADNCKIWFYDGYTAAYRISDDRISRTALTAPFTYRILNDHGMQRNDVLAPEVRRALRKAIEVCAPSAVSGYARMGKGFEALRILISSDYLLRDRFRMKFLLHSALTLAALAAGARGVALILAVVNGYTSRTRKHEVIG